jgi:transcriptional regulator with XRE-family HTH domain
MACAMGDSSGSSFLMAPINAQDVNRVNAARGNRRGHHLTMGRKAEKPSCPFWKRLESAWKDRNLPTSQLGVAEELGMKGNGSTQRWFRGEALPETDTLMKIATLGNVTIDWLLLERLPKHPVERNTELGAIHASWGSLGDAGREHLYTALLGQLALQQRGEEEAPPLKGTGK